MDINKCYLPYVKDKTRILLFRGGAGSGKSRFCAQKLVLRMVSESDFTALALRKFESKARTSIYKEVQTVIKDEKLEHLFDFGLSPLEITYKPNNNKILFAGLDDPDKIKSISGIVSVWMDEADQFTKEDFLQLNLRLRGKIKTYFQMLLSFNPTSEESWLKSTFYDEEYAGSKCIFTTYKDNAFIDDQYEASLNELAKQDINYARVYIYGEWGRANSDGLFYKNFDAFIHCEDDVVYNPELPLWVSWDFNVLPFVTATVAQLDIDGSTLNIIDEICLPAPKNNTKETAIRFLQRYRTHEAGLFVTGDPAGKHQDTRTEAGWNDFKIIEKELRLLRPIMKVPVKHPAIIPRGQFINEIFGANYSGLKIRINKKKCPNLVIDLNNIKESNTGKLKQRVKEKKTGQSMEKYGHNSDTLDYLVCVVWYQQFQEFLKGKESIKYILGKREKSKKFWG